MTFLLQVLIIGLGLVIYYSRPKYIVYYWISLYPIVLPLFCLGALVLDRELFYALEHATFTGGRNFFFLLVLLELLKKKEFPSLGRIFPFFFIIVLYLFIHAFLLHPNEMNIWPDVSELLSQLLPLIFFVQRKDLLPPVNKVFKFICFIVVIQIICAILELNGIHVYLTFFIPYIEDLGNGYLSVYEKAGIRGSFPGTAGFANFVTTIFLFISLEYFSKKRISSLFYCILSVVFFLLILLSGVRACLALFMIIIFVGSSLFIKKNLSFFVVSVALLVFSSLFLLSLDPVVARNLTPYDGINRQLAGLTTYRQADNDSEMGTLFLSSYLIDNYWEKSPIIGNGLIYKGEYAYGSFSTVNLVNFRADSRLALILVEYGIVGLLLYLLFFYSIINYLNRSLDRQNRKKMLACYLFFLLVTIVDPGFFDRLCFPMLYVYALSVLYSSNQYPSAVKKCS